MKRPMISVVMPVYNGGKYLQEAINSILNQTYKDFEFIIINDGSTDATEEIVLSYSDHRIVYVKNQENLQIVKTLNKGISIAKGKYIARMDADDLSMPERFEKQISFMEQNPEVGVCGTWVETFGSKQSQWSYPVTNEELEVALLFYSPFAHPTVFVRKDLFSTYSYDESYNKAEDYHLWSKCFKNYKLSNIPEYLLKYRLHTTQTGASYRSRQLELSYEIRKDLLKEFGVNFSRSEFKTHLKLSMNKPVNYRVAEDWFIRLLDHNKNNPIYDQSAFESVVAKRWFKIANQNAQHGLSVFVFYFFESQLPKQNKLLDLIKLFVKCLIRYNVYK